jgi:hypothetical protein
LAVIGTVVPLMCPEADPVISTDPFMQLALKSPAIEVGVWFVIFHSKLPHDFGSGGVNDIEVQTPMASGERPPGPVVGMTTSRADSNPQAAARSDATANPAIG